MRCQNGRCVGYYAEEDSPSRRLGRPLVFCRTESDCPLENGYARPVEGIHVLVDMRQMQVIEFEDRHFVPLPPPDPLRNYTAAASRGGVDRTDIKPLLITQPEGPSFRVNGHAVEWQKVDPWSILKQLSLVFSISLIPTFEQGHWGDSESLRLKWAVGRFSSYSCRLLSSMSWSLLQFWDC